MTGGVGRARGPRPAGRPLRKPRHPIHRKESPVHHVLRLQLQTEPEEVETDAPISTYSLSQCGNDNELSPA
ncbi:hypothetical protein GCM10027199_55030 [Amycolatopsis magusensis]